jgi:hypothetical protein
MRGVSGQVRLWSAVALAMAILLPSSIEAQGVRGSARTQTRFIEMRPITRDSVSLSRVTQRPEGGLEFDGHPVFCVDERCFYYRSLAVENAVALTQDVSFTAWGLGVQGLSVTSLLRTRARLAGDFVLPRSEDHFDAILAYAELNRERYRLRLGRQETLSYLGTPGFDGLDVLYTPNGRLRLGAFGGRSLGRGLYEPRSSALRALDDGRFLVDDQSALLGFEAGLDDARLGSAVFRYEREIFADRSALLSERMAVSARSTALRPLTLRGAAEYDFAFGRIGKAHATAELPFAGRRAAVEATLRRYVPFLELWTIWGFFDPVAFHEGELRASWSPAPALQAWASGAYRAYGETEAAIFGDPLRDEAWRGTAGANLRLTDRLALNGSYEIEGAVGAFLNSGTAVLGWQPTATVDVNLRAVAMQQLEEFRIGEGRLWGGGAGLGAELRPGLHLSGGLDVFRQTHVNRPGRTDWNQRRGWMMLQVDFGRDAGARRGAGS